MNIKGKMVLLRAPERRDVELLHKWANDPEIWALLGGWHFPYASHSTERWVESLDGNNLKSHVFAIEGPDSRLIGTANLVNIDWRNRNAEHGITLGDKDVRGKGYGLDTVMAIMRYAFDHLGLERLDTDMIETNTRSINFYTKSCGWELEGRKKNWHFRNGRFLDKVIVGITRQQYAEHVERTGYWG